MAWCGVAGFLVAAHGSVDLGGLSGNLLCLTSATFWADVSTLTRVILVLSAVFPLYASFRLWARALSVLGVATTTRVGVLVPIVAGVSSARLGASRDLPPGASG